MCRQMRQRLAVRAVHSHGAVACRGCVMQLSVLCCHAGNRYVKHFRNIRAIQDYLGKSGASNIEGVGWGSS